VFEDRAHEGSAIVSIPLCHAQPSFLIASNVLGDVCQVAPAGGAQLERGAPNCVSHHHRALVDPFELNTVAWNYRERTGEIDDAPLASRFLAAPSNKWSGAASDAG
jgi:hypothetical protein